MRERKKKQNKTKTLFRNSRTNNRNNGIAFTILMNIFNSTHWLFRNSRNEEKSPNGQFGSNFRRKCEINEIRKVYVSTKSKQSGIVYHFRTQKKNNKLRLI